MTYVYSRDRKFSNHMKSYMIKYFSKKQEIDKFLEKIITPYIKSKKLKILDACCGIGHISYYLSKISPNSQFIGIDQTPSIIREGRKFCPKNIQLKVGDIYRLRKKEFDISINWKTISFMPNYKKLLKTLVRATKDHIFLSSLFYEGDLDFEVKVKDGNKLLSYYNVYSLPLFREYVLKLGISNMQVYDFDIGIDIKKPRNYSLGTYTLRLHNGKRLQVSGVVVMSWKIIRLDLHD